VGRPKRDIGEKDPHVRKAVLKSAADLFNRKGYAGTTVREIVAAAGVTKPVLYYYFGNKEGIFLELVRSPFEELRRIALEIQEGSEKASDRLLALFDRIFALFCENTEAARLMYSIYYGPVQGSPFFDFESYHAAVATALSNLVRDGIECGEWCADNTEESIWAILGALSVAVETRLSHPDRSIGREGLSRILKLIFRGMTVMPVKENAC
jgi:TetR/AcrR family transcriptional regulator